MESVGVGCVDVGVAVVLVLVVGVGVVDVGRGGDCSGDGDEVNNIWFDYTFWRR